MLAAQHRWARAVQRRVTGSQTRLPTSRPAAPAISLPSDSPSSLSTPTTIAASATVPAIAKANRRVVGQAPVVRAGRLARTRRAIVPSGAATSPAMRSAPNLTLFRLGYRRLTNLDDHRRCDIPASSTPVSPGGYGALRHGQAG